jgi:hypothetical protein
MLNPQLLQVTREQVKTIYNALKYKSTPFKKKKVVVRKSELKNFENHCGWTFISD